MKTLFRWLFDPWVIIGSVMLTGLLFGGFVLFFMGLRVNNEQNQLPTVVLNVIKAPTYTPIPPVASQNTDVDSTENPIPTPQDGDIRKGMLVQVTGTQGDGLRLRAEPGLDSEVQFLAFEAEVFKVEDGPQEKSGYIWWYLVAPYDDSVRGWAVTNFIKIFQQP
jgi:hypothetical protein